MIFLHSIRFDFFALALRLSGSGIFLFLSGTLSAQSASPSQVQWSTDIDTAKRDATEQQKKIFLYFSGSDWCKPCIRLREKEINTEQFAQFAQNNLILLQADFPRLKKNQLSKEQVRHNEALAEKYNSEGTFPLIVILDMDGKVIGKAGYREETSEEFVRRIQQLIAN